jgi:hypothetical protein
LLQFPKNAHSPKAVGVTSTGLPALSTEPATPSNRGPEIWAQFVLLIQSHARL